MRRLKKIPYLVKYWLHQPARIFMACVVVFCISLALNGTLWRVWSLHRDQARFIADIAKTKLDVKTVESQMKVVKDPQYIERLAQDKMDLLDQNDLMFVFPN